MLPSIGVPGGGGGTPVPGVGGASAAEQSAQNSTAKDNIITNNLFCNIFIGDKSR